MGDWVDKNLELLEKHLNSKECEEYFDNYAKKLKLKAKRYERFEEWLKTNDFEKLIYRLLLEHGEEWREKCWENGCEVYPNNKLEFLIDYVVHNTEPVKVPKLNNKYGFTNQIWFFKGYYFQMTWGQGMVTDIYNGSDLKHLLQV